MIILVMWRNKGLKTNGYFSPVKEQGFKTNHFRSVNEWVFKNSLLQCNV